MTSPAALYESAIRSSELFDRFNSLSSNLEVWPDSENDEGGYAYFWIVDNAAPAVRMLGYVRCNSLELQHRTYDAEGDDLWIQLNPA